MKPPPWSREGVDPDYRFSLANERTFLAWVRTALGLLAGALVLRQFGAEWVPGELGRWGSVLVALLASVLGAGAYLRWKGNEIAMRHARSLPHSPLLPFLSGAIVALALACGVLVWLHR